MRSEEVDTEEDPGEEWGGDAQLAEGAEADGYGVVAGGGSERRREYEWAADAHRAGGHRAGACGASLPRTHEGVPPLSLLSVPSLVFCHSILLSFAQLLRLLVSFTLLNLNYIYILMPLLSRVYLRLHIPSWPVSPPGNRALYIFDILQLYIPYHVSCLVKSQCDTFCVPSHSSLSGCLRV